MVQNRTLERQIEFVSVILNNLVRTKKPVLVTTTKCDDASEMYMREVEKLVCRKEYKGNIPLVETSAHENINVELAFVTLGQLIDRNRGRIRIVPFHEAARQRKEVLDIATEAYQRLIHSEVTDSQTLWTTAKKKLAHHADFLHFCDLFGMDTAQRLYRKYIQRLKDEQLAIKLQNYLDSLPLVFAEFYPTLESIQET